MANNYGHVDVIRQLMEKFKNSQIANRPKIITTVTCTKNNCQYVIIVFDQSPFYYTQVFCGDNLIETIESDDIDGLMRYMLEGDKTIFDNLVNKAILAIDKLH